MQAPNPIEKIPPFRFAVKQAFHLGPLSRICFLSWLFFVLNLASPLAGAHVYLQIHRAYGRHHLGSIYLPTVYTYPIIILPVALAIPLALRFERKQGRGLDLWEGWIGLSIIGLAQQFFYLGFIILAILLARGAAGHGGLWWLHDLLPIFALQSSISSVVIAPSLIVALWSLTTKNAHARGLGCLMAFGIGAYTVTWHQYVSFDWWFARSLAAFLPGDFFVPVFLAFLGFMHLLFLRPRFWPRIRPR